MVQGNMSILLLNSLRWPVCVAIQKTSRQKWEALVKDRNQTANETDPSAQVTCTLVLKGNRLSAWFQEPCEVRAFFFFPSPGGRNEPISGMWFGAESACLFPLWEYGRQNGRLKLHGSHSVLCYAVILRGVNSSVCCHLVVGVHSGFIQLQNSRWSCGQVTLQGHTPMRGLGR